MKWERVYHLLTFSIFGIWFFISMGTLFFRELQMSGRTHNFFVITLFSLILLYAFLKGLLTRERYQNISLKEIKIFFLSILCFFWVLFVLLGQLFYFHAMLISLIATAGFLILYYYIWNSLKE